jgi:hypothetical protein
VAAAVLGWLLAAGGAQAGEPVPVREYEVKAVFLFNFAQFIDWPESALADTNAVFVIGVLGEDPFGAVLDQIVSGERIRGRPLTVRRFRKQEDARGCHLVFVSRSEKGHLTDIVRRLGGQGILTVSDVESFSRLGGMITFKMVQGRVQFEINVAAAEKEGFRLSAKLLRVAQLVNGGP